MDFRGSLFLPGLTLSIRGLSLLLTGLLLLASPKSLVAQNLYFGVDAGAGVIRVPNHQFFASREDAAPFAKLADLEANDGDGAGLMLGGRLGYTIGMPLMGAYKSHVEVNGFYLNSEDSSQATFLDNDPAASFGWIPISVTPPFGTTDGESLITDVSQRTDYGGYDVLLKQDYRFWDSELLTIYGGFTTQYLYQDFTSRGEIGPEFVDLTESLNTNYYGGKLGLAHSWRLPGKWNFLADTSLSWLKADTKFRTHYEDSDTRIVDQQLRRQQDTIAASARLELGRPVFRNTDLALFTTFNYLSYAPQIGYGEAGIPSPPAGAPAILDKDLYALLFGLKLITTW